jgi:L-2-aminoadipate reductase
MPLNPNGKVDKPALPFPDTAQLAAASRQSRKDSFVNGAALSRTQQTVRDIWRNVIPHAPQDIGINDNFFDVGGHSILATRVVFEIRKRFAIDLPLGILFRQPTIAGLSEEIDILRGGSFDVTSRPLLTHVDQTSDYSTDAVELMERLANSYEKSSSVRKEDSITVFLTGATGFLGAFLIRDLLSRQQRTIRIITHVRAKSIEEGLERVKDTCQAYGVWNNDWVSRIEVVTGSLESDHLGLAHGKWDELSRTVDVVIHNGAMVCRMLLSSSRSTILTVCLGPLGLSLCSNAWCQCNRNIICDLPL